MGDILARVHISRSGHRDDYSVMLYRGPNYQSVVAHRPLGFVPMKGKGGKGKKKR